MWLKMRKYKTNCKNQELWITSYADLVSAILAVLVLMISFSKIDIEKYDMIQRLMVEKKEQKFDNFSTLQEIKEKLDAIATQNSIEDKVNVELNSKGLIISFDSAAQFDSAKYTLKEDGISNMLPIFNEIVNQSTYRYVDIVGYTDDIPGLRMTNWQLSALRALAIQKKLEEFGLNNKNVRLIANAENEPMVEYKDKVGEDLKKARAKNRRVSIIIRDAKFDDLKKEK